MKNGFFVTELIGQGVNIVTGDYSRGAAGIWIRDGELAFPVSEVTIASHSAGDAGGNCGDRERFALSRLDGIAYPDDWGDDRWWKIKLQLLKDVRSRYPRRW